MTVDQRLTSNISFYGSAFYSNRRGHYLNPSNLSPAGTNIIQRRRHSDVQPVLPDQRAERSARPLQYRLGKPEHHLVLRVGAALSVGPEHRASGRLERPRLVLADAGRELQPSFAARRTETRSPRHWAGRSRATPPAGTTPGDRDLDQAQRTFPISTSSAIRRPTSATRTTTLAYIQGIRSFNEQILDQRKGRAVRRPAVRSAGRHGQGRYRRDVHQHHSASDDVLDNTDATSLIVPYQQDAQGRQIWAAFTQVNIPIFSEQNALPFLRRVDLEVSWRHDQYSDVKGTSNPKVAFNWAPIDDFTIRGTWGTSFRAPVFGEISPLANVAIAGQNLGDFAQQQGDIDAGCTAGGLAAGGLGRLEGDEFAWPGGDGTPGSATSLSAGAFVLPNGYTFGQHPAARRAFRIIGGSGGVATISAPAAAGTEAGRSDARNGDQLGHRLRLHADHQFPHRPESPGHLLRHQDQQPAAGLRQPDAPIRSTIPSSAISPSWCRPTLPTTRICRATRPAPAICCRRPARRSRPRSRAAGQPAQTRSIRKPRR